MSFTSLPFLYFFAAFLVIYALCPVGLRRFALLLGSLVFVLLNSWTGALWALGFTALNFLLGYLVHNSAQRKRCMRYAVAIDVVLLCTFKLLGTLPSGISFYTFAFIAYLIDIGRGELAAERNPIKFANYALFYPKYLMGPITRYGELSEQLDKPRYSLGGIQHGLESFVLGFAMKILLADKLAILWNEILKIGYESISTPLAWLGAFGFSLQLYLEWQGYTLMAVGIARMLGYKLPQNFNYPYLAKSISDFYRRWHMTLTRWFKDYLYIPLGGNRKGLPRTLVNILIVWLVTSLWHGLGWNFVFWGMGIGLLIVVERVWLGKALEKLHVLPHLWVLLLIPLTWVCFAIPDVGELGTYLARMVPIFGVGETAMAGDFGLLLGQFWPYLLGGVLCCFPFVEGAVHKLGRNWVVSAVLAVLFWWAVYEMVRTEGNTFMYLNF